MHPKTEEYTFFSSACGTFFRTDHLLGCKISLNKFNSTEIISRIFSGHNGVKLEVNHKKKKKKKKNKKKKVTQRLNNTLHVVVI